MYIIWEICIFTFVAWWHHKRIWENILLTTGWGLFFGIESFFHAGADFNFSRSKACSSNIGLKIYKTSLNGTILWSIINRFTSTPCIQLLRASTIQYVATVHTVPTQKSLSVWAVFHHPQAFVLSFFRFVSFVHCQNFPVMPFWVKFFS